MKTDCETLKTDCKSLGRDCETKKTDHETLARDCDSPIVSAREAFNVAENAREVLGTKTHQVK